MTLDLCVMIVICGLDLISELGIYNFELVPTPKQRVWFYINAAIMWCCLGVVIGRAF